MKNTLQHNLLKLHLIHKHHTSFPMGKTSKILRKSIFTFLQNYQYFTSTPSLLTFPFAISILLSQSLISSSNIFPLVRNRLTSLFLASGFPPSSELFAILNLKLSQTILSFIFVSPFSLSFLLFSKSMIIESFKHPKTEKIPFFQWIKNFNPIFITQLCNSLVLLSANATCFTLLIIYFTFFNFLGLSKPGPLLVLSATGTVIYSIILANAYIICNLSLVLSGMEKRGGFIAILKTCIFIQGKNGTALSLAVSINMALAGVEALFQYRILKGYHRDIAINWYMVMEGMLIAYMYAMLLVLDTIVGFTFLRNYRTDYRIDRDDTYFRSVGIEERDGKNSEKMEMLEVIA